MTGATFGRKGLAGASPAPLRAPVFGQATRADARPPGEDDEMARRREAFIAAERARRGESAAPATLAHARAQSQVIEALAAALRPRPPETFEGKSYPIAFLLWTLFGVAGAHRLYLNRPISGATQAAIFAISFALVALGHYPAFLGLVFCTLWMLFDARLISRMSKARR
jgi:TM2 domain-containing membrane protein YozV